MARDVDVRDFARNRATEERTRELNRIAATQSGLLGDVDLTVDKIDPFTGNPSLVKVESPEGDVAGLEGSGNFIQRALEFMQANSQVFGLSPGQPPEFEPDPMEQRLSSDAVVVHLQQKYKGIPLFQAAQTIRFAPTGALTEVAGSTVTVAQDQSVSPALSVEEAVVIAATYVTADGDEGSHETDAYGQLRTRPEIDLTGFEPTVMFSFNNKPERYTIFEAGPFGGQIAGGLVWFPLGGGGEPILAWAITIPLPEGQGHFLTIVDATDGSILFNRDLTQEAAASGMVYTVSPQQNRRTLDFPQPWSIYGLNIPTDLQDRAPDDWTDSPTTSGSAAHARLMPNGNTVSGTQHDGVIVFNPSDRFGNEQNVLNAFYYACTLHDLFYLLGFREQDGNFQGNHALGTGADPVDVQIFQGSIDKTASFTTPPDGTSPTMRLGLVTNTNRHTALDATVVFHEYTHGVTNRLVGGSANAFALMEPQCRAMGEGFSDFFACTLTGESVVGAWLVNNAQGIRQFRYDNSFPASTDNFGRIGSGRYTVEHNIGEIWCAALTQMHKNLVDTLGQPVGTPLTLQLVIDGLKLSAPNPSFLDMRDALLGALENMRAGDVINQADHASALRSFWGAFSKFGMGPDARSNGPSLHGIQADFQEPSDLSTGTDGGTTPTQRIVRQEAAPALAIPENDPQGTASRIVINDRGIIRSIRVAVQITHSYIGDLQVGLLSPQGKLLVLFDRSGDDQINLERIFNSNDNQMLASLTGSKSQGVWWLGVRDLAAKDSGTLEHWGIELAITDSDSSAGLQEQPVERYGFG